MARNKGEPMPGMDTEELAQLDKLLGDDWADLSDDELIGRISKAEKELAVTKASADGGDMATFFARLQTQLAEALDTSKQPFDMITPQPDRKPGGPGFSSTAQPVSGPIPSSSPGDPRIVSKVAEFLDDASELSDSDIRRMVQNAKSGVPISVKPKQKVVKLVDVNPVGRIKKALDMWDSMDEVQKSQVRTGNPLTWLLEEPDADVEVVKNAATMLGGVRELIRRGRAGGELTLS